VSETSDVCARLPESLRRESGSPSIGVALWRPDRPLGEPAKWHVGTVEEFLSRPENQSGIWLIDGGWGGPPGPLTVAWTGKDWENCGWWAGDGRGLARRIVGEGAP
jgi:hypothetical protein